MQNPEEKQEPSCAKIAQYAELILALTEAVPSARDIHYETDEKCE